MELLKKLLNIYKKIYINKTGIFWFPNSTLTLLQTQLRNKYVSYAPEF